MMGLGFRVSKLGCLLGVLFIRVPYYFGELKKDPDVVECRSL